MCHKLCISHMYVIWRWCFFWAINGNRTFSFWAFYFHFRSLVAWLDFSSAEGPSQNTSFTIDWTGLQAQCDKFSVCLAWDDKWDAQSRVQTWFVFTLWNLNTFDASPIIAIQKVARWPSNLPGPSLFRGHCLWFQHGQWHGWYCFNQGPVGYHMT